MLTFALLAAIAASVSPPQTPNDVARWERQAQNVTIIRDDWGIAHVYGKTDADAVFGLIYAQAEDDFNRIETNYLNAMGRLAEAEGESRIYQDLRMKLFIDPDSMRALYAASPAWLKALMNAWADGLNFYLYKHPEVKPRVIRRFEPWMALTFSEGSIGGDIERVSLRDLEACYGAAPSAPVGTGGEGDLETEPTGSNGIAIAPANTVNHHALLLINPHTSFFFRAEVQVVSDEGLDAYGAVTWGQFFVYQGFNDRTGWMHTSSGVDAIDEYLETVVQHGGRYAYRYGAGERRMMASTITVPYKTATGMARKTFTVYRTHHGPIVRKVGDKWVSVRLMQEPLPALIQSYTRTKARDYQAFRRTMELHTNSSNNTIFADGAGDIAYLDRRDAAPPESRQRLALQLQQLAVVGGGAREPEARGLPALRRDRRRVGAWAPRDPGAAGPQGLHARRPARRRVRPLSHLVREAAPRAGRGVGSGRGGPSAQGEAR